MSVRDGRAAPFIWASVAALDHLRAHWSDEAEVRPHVGRSVYYALCELANEERKRSQVHEDSGRFRTSRKRICEQAGVSDKPVDKALRELERIGLLSVERAEASGSRPGSASAYTIHEPSETYGASPHVPDIKGAEKLRTSSGGSPHVGAEEVRTAPHIGKKGKEEETPVVPRQRVNKKLVTPAEYSLASEIVAAFNQAAGAAVTADAHLTPIVGRIREKPDLTAEDHRGIIAAVFAVPWWTGAASPSVIYGNAAQFERSIETWRVAPKAVLHAVEPEPDPDDFAADRERFVAAWPEITARLRATTGESTFGLWLEPLQPLGATGSTVLLGAPEAVKAWSERRYTGLIKEALAGHGGGWTAVKFCVISDEAEAAA